MHDYDGIAFTLGEEAQNNTAGLVHRDIMTLLIIEHRK